MRASGILLPVSSLPSPYGIGTFGKAAYDFVAQLKKANQKYWQILPLGPTSYGDSPYQSFSTFAGNPYFIDLDLLCEKGLLKQAECRKLYPECTEERVDYQLLWDTRFLLLRKAFSRADRHEEDFLRFVEENAWWLEDYALYMAVKASFGYTGWQEWDDDIRFRDPETLAGCREELAEDLCFWRYVQYLFASQWQKLKQYANEQGIRIIGDIPIYVATDSADVWSNPELFQMDETLTPVAVAGCPPDAFSATGQLWGNPLYNWPVHQETGYAWWMRRMAYALTLYDVVRIDHFRGFDEYYSIPFGDETAQYGHWEKGPGKDFFKVLKQKLGKCSIIAEDLGYLTKSVIRLQKWTGYPGMKVLQFAFDSREDSDYLPHNYEHNCVVYTGTHDNQTTKAWYQEIAASDRRFAREYLNLGRKRCYNWDFIRAAFASTADTAIIPMQDFLELGGEARINHPSTLGGNWEWRMNEGAFDDSLAERIAKLSRLYAR